MPWILDGLAELHGALRADGYTVIGPTHRDGAIVLAELASADDLPYGWGVTLEPGDTGLAAATMTRRSPIPRDRSRGNRSCTRRG